MPPWQAPRREVGQVGLQGSICPPHHLQGAQHGGGRAEDRPKPPGRGSMAGGGFRGAKEAFTC